MHLISIQNLEKVYENELVKTPALRGISFQIERGEFVAIMGPSGSGKSTLLHILGFLEHQSSGQYLFLEKANTDYTDAETAVVRNQKIGFIFQAFNLLSRSTVLDNVILPLSYSQVSPREWEIRARQAIESVGLSHRLFHEPAQLSGGEKQRVAIARALVNNPEVIFADEPTGNLDSKSGQIVMEILQKLNKEKGHTIVLITHETTTAEHAERVIQIRDGLIESDKKVENRRESVVFIK